MNTCDDALAVKAAPQREEEKASSCEMSLEEWQMVNPGRWVHRKMYRQKPISLGAALKVERYWAMIY